MIKQAHLNYDLSTLSLNAGMQNKYTLQVSGFLK